MGTLSPSLVTLYNDIAVSFSGKHNPQNSPCIRAPETTTVIAAL